MFKMFFDTYINVIISWRTVYRKNEKQRHWILETSYLELLDAPMLVKRFEVSNEF